MIWKFCFSFLNKSSIRNIEIFEKIKSCRMPSVNLRKQGSYLTRSIMSPLFIISTWSSCELENIFKNLVWSLLLPLIQRYPLVEDNLAMCIRFFWQSIINSRKHFKRCCTTERTEEYYFKSLLTNRQNFVMSVSVGDPTFDKIVW